MNTVQKRNKELTISGQVKGTIHANRVKLNSTAVVEGDIFHRSLDASRSQLAGTKGLLSRLIVLYCAAPLASATPGW